MLNEDANDNSQSANELIEQTKTIKNGKHQMNDSAMLSAKPVKEVTLKITPSLRNCTSAAK